LPIYSGGIKVEFKIIEKTTHSGRITELYSRLAWMYDFFTDHELAHHKKAVQMAEIKENDVVLEVACGTGRATVEIAKLIGEKGKFYAIDLTQEMLGRAKNKLRKHNLLDKVDLKLGDAKNLPFPDETFDIVYNAYMFDLIDIDEFSAILSEFKRVLKPSGKLVLVNMSKNKAIKTLYEFLYERRLLGFTSGSCRPVFMKPFLEEAGFEKVERIYRKNRSCFFLNLLVGTEIVIGYKPRF
jgi:demethylmenaquinone methyltransferase/2-methoxy-6-polyprenyl-1,4-benzoquinol methylase